MSFNRRQFILAGVALAAPVAHGVRAEPMADLELTLALDASGSMFDPQKTGVKHWDIQVAGHLYALSQQEIVAGLVTAHLRIIIWSDGRIHPIVFDARVRSESDLEFARSSLKKFQPPCSINGCAGTDHYTAVQLVLSLPRMGYRRVLDISTDETTSSLYQPRLDVLREKFEGQDGTINALAVSMTPAQVNDLQTNLCTPSGQCFRAVDWSDYAEALRRKIITEIA